MRNEKLNGKYRLILGMFALFAMTTTTIAQPPANPVLLQNCLACHHEQKLPDNLIYRRYLLKYSTADRIEDALMKYLKHPTKQTSIMPAEFFLRFPLKYGANLDEESLQESIRRYVEYFDVRKRLVLEK